MFTAELYYNGSSLRSLMNPESLKMEIARMVTDLNAGPSDELIDYATERGWLNVSRSNAANNWRAEEEDGRHSSRSLRIEIQWRIFRGFLQDEFSNETGNTNAAP